MIFVVRYLEFFASRYVGDVSLKTWHKGLLLMVSSFIVWMLATSLRFWYVLDNHPELGIGEPIWAIDPIVFMIISVPLGIVFFVGFLVIFGDILQDG